MLELFLYNIKAAGVNHLVTPIKTTGEVAMRHILRGPFDFAFIDGSHYYPDVLTDLTLAKDLLSIGGILSGDDLELQMDECDNVFAEGCKEDYVQDPRTGTMFHPGVTRAVYELSDFGFASMMQFLYHFDPVLELHAGNYLGERLESPQAPKTLLCAHAELEHQGEHRLAGHTTLGTLSAVAYRAERRLDHVAGADMRPGIKGTHTFIEGC